MEKGYKVFNPDWTCRDKQYTCPAKFEENVELSICKQGMHFCKKAIDCFNYYDFNPANKVAEVIAYGYVVEKYDKCVTNKLEIVREISWSELLELVNTGKGCTGYRNSGNYNSGNGNSGDFNSGDCNHGNHNSGDFNSGKCNSGDYNSGCYNSGNYNSGNRNNGFHNSGDYNSGSWNNGSWNSGCRNSGDNNSGDWNKCNFSNGCFNTEDPQIFLFNKPSDRTYQDWKNSYAHEILNQMPASVKWVDNVDMTKKEKSNNPSYVTTGGYLKTITDNTFRQEWWDELEDDEKIAVKSIPNFDADIFKEITGIDTK